MQADLNTYQTTQSTGLPLLISGPRHLHHLRSPLNRLPRSSCRGEVCRLSYLQGHLAAL